MNYKMMILKTLMDTMSTFASEELMMKVADGILDAIENAVENSSNKIDDMVILPICKRAREVFNIEDNDDIGVGE